MAILESVRELASKLGAETNGRDITDQLNKINKHLDETALGGRDIAEAVRTYSENAGGGGGVGFNKMIVNYPPRNKGLAFINNSNSSVDISDISTDGIYVLNPVDELKVEELKAIGNGYDVYFVPTQNCKIYEGDTELNINDIFVPVQTPAGPTTYDPDGVTVFRINGEKTPYATTRELRDEDAQVKIAIE
jgi:hypothetical protein